MSAGYTPCESCGTPIRLRDPQPESEPRDQLPAGGPVWDEEPIDSGAKILTWWHSPNRCRRLRIEREDG